MSNGTDNLINFQFLCPARRYLSRARTVWGMIGYDLGMFCNDGECQFKESALNKSHLISKIIL